MDNNLYKILIFAILINKELTIFRKLILILSLFIFLSIYTGFPIRYKTHDLDYKDIDLEKNFIINLNVENKNIVYFLNCFRNFLKSKNWEELSKYDAKKEDKIGFSICGNKKNISLKSQINYGIYTQQDSIFSNKIYFKEHFKDEKYFKDVVILQKDEYINNPKNLINLINVNIKNGKLNDIEYFILKGLDYSNGKQLLIFNKNKQTKKDLNKINDFLLSMNHNLFLLDEFVESIKFKVEEVSQNNLKI